MANQCPVCDNSTESAVCENCGFTLPKSRFLDERQAKSYFEEVVLPYREKWKNSASKKAASTPRSRKKSEALSDPSPVEIAPARQSSDARMVHELMTRGKSVYSAAFSSNGKYLIAVSMIANGYSGNDYTYEAKSWEVVSGREIFTFNCGHDNGPGDTHKRAIVFSPDKKRLAFYDDLEGVILWEIESGKIIRKFKCRSGYPQDYPQVLAFSSDGKSLVAYSRLLSDYRHTIEIRLWQTNRGWPKAVFEASRNFASIAFSPDGTYLACGSPSHDAVSLRDARNGKEIRRIGEGSFDYGSYLVFSPDGRSLASANGKDLISLLDVKNYIEIFHYTYQNLIASSIKFSPDGKYLAACYFRRRKPLPGLTMDILSPAFSVPVDCVVSVLDIENRKKRIFEARSDSNGSVEFSPDGKRLVFTSRDSTKLWEVDSGKEIYAVEKKGFGSAVFSPDGKYLACTSISDPRVIVYDLALT